MWLLVDLKWADGQASSHGSIVDFKFWELFLASVCVSPDHNLNLVFFSTPSFLRPHLVIAYQAALAGETPWLPSPCPVRLALLGLYTTNMDVGFSPSMALGHLQVCLDVSAPLLNPPKAATCIHEPHGDSGATLPAPTYDSHH